MSMFRRPAAGQAAETKKLSLFWHILRPLAFAALRMQQFSRLIAWISMDIVSIIFKGTLRASHTGPLSLMSPLVSISAKDHLVLQMINESDPTTRIYCADLISPFKFGPLKASLFSLPPATRIIPRAHSHSPAFIYVLAGSGICWYHGSPYKMGQNDCVGFRAGSGLGFAFINDGHMKEALEFLLLSEEHPDDTIAYLDAGTRVQGLTSSWMDPPSLPLGKHNGLPSLITSVGSPDDTNSSTEAFWPSTIFHSLVMSIPNMLPKPDTAEVAPLSILTSLTSSASCHFTVTQTVVQPHCRAPPYGPRAHSLEHRLLYVCAAVPNGGGKLWLDGDAVDLVTGTCIRLGAGTGQAWCVINQGDEELIFLEFAQDINEDSVYFPLAAVSNGAQKATENEMRRRVAEELGKAWWEDPPHHKLGTYSAEPEESITANNHS